MRIIATVFISFLFISVVHAAGNWSNFTTSFTSESDCLSSLDSLIDSLNDSAPDVGARCTQWASGRWASQYNLTPCDAPLNWNQTTRACVPPPCNSPNVTNPITGACETPSEQCADEEQPDKCECQLNGGSWLQWGNTGECTSNPDPDGCDPSSPDYAGSITDSEGNISDYCNDRRCEGQDSPGYVNGEFVCIPPDYGPPDCKFDTIAVAAGENGDGGWTCVPPDNQPEPPEPPDSDGDGTPDANDPDSNDSDGDGNPDSQGSDHDGDGVSNSDDPDYQSQYGDGAAAQASRDNGTKIDQTNEALNDLNQQIQNQGLAQGKTNDLLDGLNGNLLELTDHVTADSTATAGLLDGVQTVGESNQAIATAWQSHPTISSFSQIPTLTVSNSCPVFVIPATQFFSAIPMTIICEVLEDNRAILSLLFMGLWTLAAASVFMRA